MLFLFLLGCHLPENNNFAVLNYFLLECRLILIARICTLSLGFMYLIPETGIPNVFSISSPNSPNVSHTIYSIFLSFPLCFTLNLGIPKTKIQPYSIIINTNIINIVDVWQTFIYLKLIEVCQYFELEIRPKICI